MFARLMEFREDGIAWGVAQRIAQKSETAARITVGGSVLRSCAQKVLRQAIKASKGIINSGRLLYADLNSGSGACADACRVEWMRKSELNECVYLFAAEGCATTQRALIEELRSRGMATPVYGSSHLAQDIEKMLTHPRPDILQYSPCCAPLADTNRKAVDDEARQEDVAEMLRQMRAVLKNYVAVKKPVTVVIENVSTWKVGKFKKLWSTVRKILAEAGPYDWAIDVVDPAERGFAQARKRSWIIGRRSVFVDDCDGI